MKKQNRKSWTMAYCGMAAALAALERGCAVTLIERQARLGRKLLTTGNGRCNLTNEHAAPERYHGEQPEFCRYALARYPASETLAWFADMGLETVTEADGRVYPRTNAANSVLDVLRGALGYGYYLTAPALAAIACIQLGHKGRPVILRTVCVAVLPLLIRTIARKVKRSRVESSIFNSVQTGETR